MSEGPPPVPGGRTPEDRDAARRARDARRKGEPVPPPPAEPHPAAAPRPAAAPKAPRESRVRWGRVLAIGSVLVIVAAVAWFAFSLFQPFKGEGEGNVRVTVPEGSTLSEIGGLLETEGVISSSSFFELRARLAGRADQLKPGSYRLRRDMSYAAALDALEQGVPPNVVRVSIPEGRSRREVAPLVKGAVRGSYMRASRRSPALSPRRYGAPRTATLEGFLFPATYELRKGSTAARLVREQLKAFEANFEGVDMRHARSKNLTAYDVLIIASMVEREAMLDKERPKIAGVIYNRLRDGMPLGIDSTLRYALNQWDSPLKVSELANPTPYNTRLNGGLPPGPIGNPGLASIKAAARPERTKAVYFVVKPGTCGEHAFAETDAEHQANVARYERERAARGGKSPDNC